MFIILVNIKDWRGTMIDKLSDMSLEEIKRGFSYDSREEKYRCNICGREYVNGEIFEINNRFFDARKTAEIHIVQDHVNVFEALLSSDKKSTGITENQKELLRLIYAGTSDNDIAKKTGVAPVTIRHQRFVFREKAKQAKLFLAIYELMLKGTEKNKAIPSKKEEIIDIHGGAKMIDDRYLITKAEEEKILSTLFSSLEPLRLKIFSSKEKKKVVTLKKISEQFERNRKYTEKEVNNIIEPIYEDYATIRRYLIEYGFMERTRNCREYWLK
jgi:hypothetical protein